MFGWCCRAQNSNNSDKHMKQKQVHFRKRSSINHKINYKNSSTKNQLFWSFQFIVSFHEPGKDLVLSVRTNQSHDATNNKREHDYPFQCWSFYYFHLWGHLFGIGSFSFHQVFGFCFSDILPSREEHVEGEKEIYSVEIDQDVDSPSHNNLRHSSGISHFWSFVILNCRLNCSLTVDGYCHVCCVQHLTARLKESTHLSSNQTSSTIPFSRNPHQNNMLLKQKWSLIQNLAWFWFCPDWLTTISLLFPCQQQ